jgi:hypothetical protein
VSVSRIDVLNPEADISRALGGEINAVVCAPGTYSNSNTPCFELDQPLDTRFTTGTGLTEGAMFTLSGKADFTDIAFHGHPSQYYNLTFTLDFRVGFRSCLSVPMPPECANDLKQAVHFETFFEIETRKCPLGQIGDTTTTANERPCVCDRGYKSVSGSRCEACDPGKLGGQVGTYKDWRGQAECLMCPDVNMITECSNFTGCGQRYRGVGNYEEEFVRNSLNLCWCKPGYFRSSILYRYVPFRQTDKKCIASANNGWADVYPDGRTSPLSCRPEQDPYTFCYRENSPSPDIAELDDLCSTCGPDDDCDKDCESGACCSESTCLQYESIDRGKVWAFIDRGLADGDQSVDARTPSDMQTVDDASICTACLQIDGCENLNADAYDNEDATLLKPCGCQGDGFGLGTQSCGPLYRGLLCSTCIKGFYPDSSQMCVACPEARDYLIVLSIVIFGGGLAAYLWAVYGDVIELMFDPGTIKIVFSYLMVTGSVNSSVNVSMPDWLTNITETLKFDPSGVLKCLIQSFEYTFYHNLLIMATVPITTIWLADGFVAMGVAFLRISYTNKRKIAADDEELEKLEEEEDSAIYELQESANGMKSEFLIFVHPNITGLSSLFSLLSSVFSLLSCLLCPVSCVMSLMLCLLYHVSCVMSLVSCLLCYVSCIMSLVSCLLVWLCMAR